MREEESLLMTASHEMKIAEKRIDDCVLDFAISQGIAEGQRKEKGRNKKGWWLGTVALGAAAVTGAIFVFHHGALTPSGPSNAHFDVQAVTLDSKEFSGFRMLTDKEPGVRSAFELNAVQPLQIAQEQGNCKLTINGFYAGSDRIALLFSFENKGTKPVDLNDFALVDRSKPASASFTRIDVSSIHGTRTGKMSGALHQFEPGTSYGIMEFYVAKKADWLKLQLNATLTPTRNRNLQTDIKLPKNPVSFAFKDPTVLYGKTPNSSRFSLNFELASQSLVSNDRVFSIHKTMDIAGQKVDVEKAVVSPAGISLVYRYDERNTFDIHGLVEPSLVITSKSGKEYFFSSLLMPTFNSSDGRITALFKDYEGAEDLQIQSIRFKASGIRGIEKAKSTLVVDMNKKQILAGPDDSVSIVKTGLAAGGQAQVLGLKLSHNGQKHRTLSLDPIFMDGDHAEHKLTEGYDWSNEVHLYKSQEKTDTSFFYYTLDKHYPQPLTFRIRDYDRKISDPQEQELIAPVE
ncbi:CbtA family protein [Paenibacillus ottowii]|uniref:CbtA family protein n=1 Tax=Paenibacillus ottowii TaxID=2315729 RepID=A0ABY3B368_9BACL|nr:CbtA family protein [Paenibacillus ottowii]TQR97293.1 CbtA family protein [Paenibacillus ottowii]